MKSSFKKIGEMVFGAEETIKKMAKIRNLIGVDNMPPSTNVEFEVAKKHLEFLKTFDQNAGTDTLHPSLLERLSNLNKIENPSDVDKEYIRLLTEITTKFQEMLEHSKKSDVYDTKEFYELITQRLRHSFKTSIGVQNRAELDAYNEMLDQTIGLFSGLSYSDTSEVIYNIKGGLEALVEARDSDNLNPGGLGALDALAYVLHCVDELYEERKGLSPNLSN